MKTVVLIALGILIVPVPALCALYGISAYTCNSSTDVRAIGPDPVSWGGTFDDCMAPQLWTDLDATAGRGALRAWAVTRDNNATDEYHGAIGGIIAQMQFDDLMFFGPGLTVDVSLNLDLYAFLSAYSVDGTSAAGVEINVALGTNYFNGNAFADEGSDPDGPQDWALLDGLLVPATGGYEVDAEFSTPTAQLPVNSTIGLTITLTAYGAAYDPYGIADSLTDARHTLSFPESGPVFNLPPGYSVQCPGAGIVDNEWAGEVATDQQSWGQLKARY